MNLETDRLRISKFFEQDWAMLQEIVIDKEHSTYAYMDHTWPTGADQIKEICNGFAKGDEFLAVRTKQDNQLIGFVCLNNTDNPKNKNLGYCLHSRHQGQGFAFEACAALIKHAFEVQDIETISTGTGLANRPSVRLLEKFGFIMILKESSYFRTDQNGDPMWFEGGLFELTEERWAVSCQTLNSLR